MSLPLTIFSQWEGLSFEYMNYKDIQIPSRIVNILEDDLGRIWFGSNGGGIVIYDGYEFQNLVNIPSDSTTIISNAILQLYQDHNLDIWAGNRYGVSRIDRFTFESENYKISNCSEVNGEGQHYTESVYADSRGNYWFGTECGLSKYDENMNFIQTFILDSTLINERFSSNFAIRILEDYKDSDIIWLASADGLFSFNIVSEEVENQTKEYFRKLFGNKTNTIYYDLEFGYNEEYILAGMYGGGVQIYYPDSDKWERYTFQGNSKYNKTREGNDVKAILPIDSLKTLFLNDKGLGWIDYKKNKLEMIADFDFGKTGLCREMAMDRNGYLWMACDKGIAKSIQTISDPNLEVIIRPIISKLTVKDEVVVLDESKKLSFANQQNDLSFAFTLPNPPDKNEVSYEFMIDPIQNTWRSLGNRRFADLINLPFGEYQIRYRSKTPDKNWIEGTPLSFTIEKPFYLTLKYLILWAFLATAILWTIWTFLKYQVSKESELRHSYEMQLAEVEMKALRSQMNPHFIFNSLNSIYNFVHKNDTENAADYLAKFSKLIRQVLQNSKSKLVNLEDELQVNKLYLELEQLRFNNKFHFEINIDSSLSLECILLPPMLIQPHLENSIWHGIMHKEGQGKVMLTIHRVEDSLSILIEDNGIGREASLKLNEGRSAKQKSLGLSLSKDRISLLKELYGIEAVQNIVDLKDDEGQPNGTRVHLLIPIVETSKLTAL